MLLLKTLWLTCIRKLFCTHRYRWHSSSSAVSPDVSGHILFDTTYEYVKCGKQLDIVYDTDHQTLGGTTYITCPIKK